jgi:gluconate 2-dehydrogenase alpha chain
MSSRRAPVEVVLVGIGAANGVVAQVLTEAGVEVVALEAGPRVDHTAAAQDEIANDLRARWSAPKAAGELPTWRMGANSLAGRPPFPILMVNGVGGTTLHYEAISGRLLPWNFETRTRLVERYGEHRIPTGSTVSDWAASYDQLEPYYTQVERALGVAGAAANVVGEPQDPAGNIREGPRSEPFPMPPLRPGGWGRLMAQAARQMGWHPFPVPAAINSVAYDGRPACTYCGYCQHNVCHNNSKGAIHVNMIPRAEVTGRLRIETDARVTGIEIDSEGRACGVTFIRDGQMCYQPAKVVVVGGFVFENVRLLLLSRSRAFPDGLANNSGQVGKHLIIHLATFVQGLFPGKNLNVFNGTGAQATCVDEFNADHRDHREDDFITGGMLAAFREMGLIAHMRASSPSSVPRWGSAWKAWVAENARSIGSTWAQLDALPYEDNFLDLDPNVKDPYGLPVIRVTHRIHDNERRALEFLLSRQKMWLAAAGAAETWSFPFHVEGRHAYGGTRMGSDPATSVVDGHGFAHEVPNLAVVGASTFPTASGMNPTLTVQATSWRTAERIARELEDVGAMA